MDRRAADEFGIPVRVLMERAGMAIFNELKKMLPEGDRVTFACGKGNNGGDGFVAARLASEAGMPVDCLVACDEPDLAGDPREQMMLAKAQGVPIFFCSDKRYRRRIECLGCRDLIVDALLGTGAGGEIRGPILQAIQAINRSGVPVLSVDVPSGIHCDTGEELGESVWARKTVTLGLPKPFLFQGTGLEHAGSWQVADIGFPHQLVQEPTDARLLDCEWVANMMPERLKASHKGENGHVLIVAGSRRMPGAAVMAAKAALRGGAGLVTIASTQDVCRNASAHLPECLYLPLPDENGVLNASASEILADHADKYHAALFGPGLTHDDSAMEFLNRTWLNWNTPCVIDADALNSVSLGVALPPGECVLTPHPGEMSRLLQASIAEIQADRFATVRQAIDKFDKCVLLKGPHSIVGEPGFPLMVNRTGNPGMASGGMGDILGGLIATLMSQAVPAYHAASCAMFWHGLAADICAAEIGPIGYLATEVANALPKARAKIVASCNYEACYSSPH